MHANSHAAGGFCLAGIKAGLLCALPANKCKRAKRDKTKNDQGGNE